MSNMRFSEEITDDDEEEEEAQPENTLTPESQIRITLYQYLRALKKHKSKSN